MTSGGRWVALGGYLLLSVVLMAAALLPLAPMPRDWAPPDVLLVVTAVWAARRPDTLPVLAVAAVFLLADMLFQRPPGLHAALAIGLTEWLRRRAPRLRRGTLLDEWLAAGSGLAVVILLERAALVLVMVPQPPFGLTLIQLILTLALYPVLAGLAQVALGLRRPAQGEVDQLGHRL
ncbi:rod shape-determining protein MreD [Rubellimicrobium sp. CFH 75288]|uniref:rod shape-determining protein MreD n=1 Tax=Rubellimicrobium sp. CFH 75288 TaxID=2697034 RepID=UPI0014120AE1|nr:rod shape-determining protein MreD [Rubellimicrobium sp. CFH 75288]NAZ37084.1 rod shape-determining protein MreD [Rubellimicrobium sp. CFH 75288]